MKCPTQVPLLVNLPQMFPRASLILLNPVGRRQEVRVLLCPSSTIFNETPIPNPPLPCDVTQHPKTSPPPQNPLPTHLQSEKPSSPYRSSPNSPPSLPVPASSSFPLPYKKTTLLSYSLSAHRPS